MFADTFASAHVQTFPDGTVFPLVGYNHERMRAYYAALPFYLPQGIVTHALGPLSGQWTFAQRVGAYAAPVGSAPAPGRGEVGATTCSGGLARYVCTYLAELGPALPDTNEIGRELSPDGRRLALSVGVVMGTALRYGLVVIDLESGAKRFLTTDAAFHDVSPAWSPDGTRIAFARWTTGSTVADAGIWTIGPDGSGSRRVVAATSDGPMRVYGWTADGTAFGYGAARPGAQYRLANPASNSQVVFRGYVTSPGEWRAGTPAFVGAFANDPSEVAHLDVADANGAAQRTVLSAPDGSFGNDVRPRWRPGADEFLYLVPSSSGLAIATVSGQIRGVPTRGAVVTADWQSAAEIVYLAQDSTSTVTIRVVGADGSQARDLIALRRPVASWLETYRDLASVTYR